MKSKLILILLATLLLPGIVRGVEVLPYRWQIGDTIVPSPLYGQRLDCDDAALFDYIWLKSMGFEVQIAYGNLNTTGENYNTSNHYWVVATDNGTSYPYDMGYCIQDDQHYEFIKTSYQDLLRAALKD